MSSVLVVAVHPDDETLGCGGTLLKHKAHGDTVFWMIVTSMSQDHGFSAALIQQRSGEIRKVADSYGFDGVISLGFPATGLDAVPRSELVSAITDAVNSVKPSTMYVPFINDVHSDHRVAFEAAYSSTKTFRAPFLNRVLMMETLSETEYAPALPHTAFIPNVFVDISAFIEKKKEIIGLYTGQLDKHPFPRSLENITSLATTRGAAAGCPYAEAFMLLKERM